MLPVGAVIASKANQLTSNSINLRMPEASKPSSGEDRHGTGKLHRCGETRRAEQQDVKYQHHVLRTMVHALSSASSIFASENNQSPQTRTQHNVTGARHSPALQSFPA
jgi:hypothetical protein